MSNVVQLLVFRDPSYLRDVVEFGMHQDARGRAHAARSVERHLSLEGFDDRTQAQRDAAGDEAYAELHVVPADERGMPVGEATERVRVVPGGLPPRCTRPRACVELDGVLVDAREFVLRRLGG